MSQADALLSTEPGFGGAAGLEGDAAHNETSLLPTSSPSLPLLWRPPPIIGALEPGDNNEFTETEKCRGLNCMYLVTQTEAVA